MLCGATDGILEAVGSPLGFDEVLYVVGILVGSALIDGRNDGLAEGVLDGASVGIKDPLGFELGKRDGM